MSAFVTVASAGSRWLLARRLLALGVALLLLGALVPTSAAAGVEDGTVEIAIEGLDDVVVGTPSAVTVRVRVRDRGSIRPDTPLRLVGTLSGAEDAAVALVTGAGEDALPLDDDGSFVFPREDRAPLTLAGNPELARRGGFTATLLVTVPDGAARDVTVQLAASNERSAQVVRRYGSERAATAADISASTFNAGVPVAYVARADAFPDALAGGPSAGLAAAPILLTYPDTVPAPTIAELQRLEPQRVVVLGGTAAISDAVVTRLGEVAQSRVTRVFGSNRFATAAAIARDRYSGPIDTLYVATGEVFADALSGGPAAAKADAPLLLVARNAIPAVTAAAIRELDPRRIVVLGGSAAVSDAVVGRLAELARDGATRQYGRDRFETSAAVSRRSFSAEAVHTVYLATGSNFPDSLAGAPAAILDEAPLLLVTRDGIPARVREELERLRPGVVVLLGGTGVVGQAVADEAAALTRTVAPDHRHFSVVGAAATASFVPSGADPCDPALAAGRQTASTSVREAYLEATGANDARSAPSPGALSARRAIAAQGQAEDQAAEVEAADAPPDITTVPPAGPLAVQAPAPASLRPRDRFALTFTTPVAGAYVIEHRVADGAWATFDNPLSSGTVTGGTHTVGLNAPMTLDVREVRVRFTPEGGPEETASSPTNLSIALTFPPPLISSLIEGVADQQQLIAITPAGGSLRTGVQLDLDLSEGQRGGADYRGARLTLLNGNGTAELVFDRQADPATGEYPCLVCIEYTAGPGDYVEPGTGTPPLLTFRLDGVDAADEHASYVDGFFRYDDMHGVNRVFQIGAGSGVASPRVGDLRQGSPHTFQRVSFGIPGPPPPAVAMAPGATVTFDLSAAIAAGVDYSDAFAYVEGGGGHEADPASGVGPAHEPPPPGIGDATIDPVAGTLTFTVGPEGLPSVQPEGPLVSIFVEGIAVPATPATVDVPVRRSDGGRPGAATFAIRPMEIAAATASNLVRGAADQSQTFTATLDGDLDFGEQLFTDLYFASRGGVDYSTATVTLLEGSGAVTIGNPYGDDPFFDPDEVALIYTAGPSDDSGDEILVRVDGVDAPDVDVSLQAYVSRSDSSASRSVVFDVGAGSAIVSPYVSDLGADSDVEYQFVAFSLRDDLEPGQTARVDLSEAEAGGADYSRAQADLFFGGETPILDAQVRIDTVPGASAVAVLTAGTDGIPAGEQVYIDIYDISTEDVEEEHLAYLSRQGDPRVAVAPFSILYLPGLRDVVATDLASGVDAQTQTLCATVTGDAVYPHDVVAFDLSGAEEGAARYGGARARVVGQDGEAIVEAFTGGYAEVLYFAGEDGLDVGETIRIDLVGVNVDEADETHAVDAYRWDSDGGATALFDIGAGSAFVGRPIVTPLETGSAYDFQHVSVRLARELSGGEVVSVDLSSAEQGGAAYGDAVAFSFGSTEVALTVVEGTSAVLTFTAPPAGTSRGTPLSAAIEGVVTDDVWEDHVALVTDQTTGAEIEAYFGIYPFGDH